jgi:hypothetical protein
MSARPKSDYNGRGVNFQVRLSDDEHREFDRQRKAAGFSTLADYFRGLLLDGNKKHIVPVQDPIQPENRAIHKRFEALWNSLGEGERDTLERVLDGFGPRSKGKRAS